MVVMMAVMTGSVVLGDSVRGTLVSRVRERLGDAQTVISSGQGLLADSILQLKCLQGAHGYLVAEGFVASEGRMLPVMVWGTDEDDIPKGSTLMNETLKDEVGESGSVVVHLPSNNMVPSGSLFISQRYSTSMRLKVEGVCTADRGGNRWLHNEQMRPMNLFVNRQELAEVMGVEHRINLILTDRIVSESEFAQCWTPAYSGIKTRILENSQPSALSPQPSALNSRLSLVTSERVFLPQQLVETLEPEEVYEAYFVNSLGCVPYSFVTATTRLKGDETVLSDYAARRMGAETGDTVEMEYYVVKGLKRLETRSHRFVVKTIVPLSEFAGDECLTADFPGLSNVKRCTDWNSDLPIDMSRIGKEDEEYWEQYRQTPKAIVAWEAVKDDWNNGYGVATAVVVDSAQLSTLNSQLSSFDSRPSTLDCQLYYPREEAMRLAAGGTDFASLFLALGFFILVSAVLLMLNPLAEMYELRREEFHLYELLGFCRKKVRKCMLQEALPVLLIASPIGVLAGFAYAAMSLWLLSGPWRGATHTEGFVVHYDILSVLITWVVGLLISILVVWMAFPKQVQGSKFKVQGSMFNVQSSMFNVQLAASVLLVVLLVLNFCWLHSMVVFVVCGLLWIACAGWWGEWLVTHQKRSNGERFTRQSLWWTALRAHLPLHRIAYWTLATGVFMVFAVGLNRPDAAHTSEEATGGYKLYVESRVPIQYDLNDEAVRHHLQLDEVGSQVHFLQIQKHREDEASCLNLNRVATPSVLAMEVREMAAFGVDTTVFHNTQLQDPRFKVQGSKFNVQCSMFNVPLVPVVIDEEALMWSVMKSVGDTLHYVAADGSSVNALIVGTYPMGVLHGNVLMPRQYFNRLWPEESGSSVLMVTDDVSELLTTALSEYGVDAISVTDRLAKLFEVTDTYLSIFMALGSIGLLLGIVSLVVLILKHLAARQHEIGLYDLLGFSPRHIASILRKENAIPALYAIVVGAVGSLVSVSASMSGVHLTTWLAAICWLAIMTLTTIVLINYIINPKKLKR